MPLGVGADVEVVVAGLPEVVPVADEEFGGLLLEDFEGGRQVVAGGFGDEEVGRARA